MTISTRLLAIVAFLFGIASHSAAVAQTAFVNVSVAPMDGRDILENQTVVVDGDRVVSIADASEINVPDGATIIDGAGKFLIPGLAEMHGHIPPLSQGEQAVNDTLFLYLSNGVTTVRGMLGSDGQLSLREDAISGARLSPTLYLAGPSFNGNSISSPAQAEARVKAQAEEGWDLLKVHPGLTKAEYDAMATAANAIGIDFGGHVPQDVGLLHALDAGQRTFDHIDGYIALLNGADALIDNAALRDIARKTKDAGAGIVPTSALWLSLIGAGDKEALFNLPELQYMPASVVAGWKQRANAAAPTDASIHKENRRRLLKVLQEEGVEILFGTDAPQVFSVPGFSVHLEAAEMRAAGLTPEEILMSATANVGAYFTDKDMFGVIAPGARADLVLLNGDPLSDIDNLRTPAGVMVRGRWLSREEIDAELAAIAERRAK